MNFIISFPTSSFENVVDAYSFIKGFANFEIIGILAKEENIDYIDNDFEKISKYLIENKLTRFTIINEYDDINGFKNSITYRCESWKNLSVFYFRVESINNLKFNELLCESYKLSFTTILLTDTYKARWQNEEVISNYMFFNKEHKHLPLIWDNFRSPVLGHLVDISLNPGHLKETFTMTLMAAPSMWFGPGSLKYFRKDLLANFPEAIEIIEVLPDVIYIKLFDNEASDYETEEILAVQHNFRVWTKMDEIEKELNKKIMPPNKAAYLKIDLRGNNQNDEVK